jgi:uncharacterized coiled-coil DUF342 family protein
MDYLEASNEIWESIASAQNTELRELRAQLEKLEQANHNLRLHFGEQYYVGKIRELETKLQETAEKYETLVDKYSKVVDRLVDLTARA